MSSIVSFQLREKTRNADGICSKWYPHIVEHISGPQSHPLWQKKHVDDTDLDPGLGKYVPLHVEIIGRRCFAGDHHLIYLI